MRQYAFIGLGMLGMSMLESIAKVTDQIVVVDQNPALIDRVKDLVKTAYVADAMESGALERILPDGLDVAVVDMGDNIEAALLVTHSLKKHGVAEIIVKADSDERSEILGIVGATKVVRSDREAAARIVPLVLSSTLYNFIPIGGDLVMAEVCVPSDLPGKTLVEADLRRRAGVNVVAIRSKDSTAYKNFERDYRLVESDLLLVAGNEEDVFAFSGVPRATVHAKKRSSISTIMKTIFTPKSSNN